MATKTVVCPVCATPAEPGRYACGACGALLDGVAVRPRSWETAPGEPVAVTDGATLAVEDGADLEDAESADPRLDAFAAAIDATAGAMPDTGHEPSWPPPGAREPLPVPEPRVPAGTYLPPSAVLPPLDGPVPHASDRTAAPVVVAPSPAAPTVGSRLRTLGSPHSRRVAGRRAIAIGSGVALVGFLLPWGTASLAGLAANWLVLWGLAGPGHWLVAAGLLGMGVITASSGRPEGWPVGLPAVILGALTLGLIWTQVFGPSRPFAVVIVLVGTALLIAGGTLEETGRHEAETQSVQPIPEGP